MGRPSKVCWILHVVGKCQMATTHSRLIRVKFTRLHTVIKVEYHRKAEKFRHVYCALDTIAISEFLGSLDLTS